MIRGANILILAAIDWDFNRQTAQEVASSFAAAGNSVLFMENSGVRPPRWSDMPRIWSRARNWLQARGGLRRVEHDLDVFVPMLLPFPYSRLAGGINRLLVLSAIRRWLRRHGGRPFIVITFLPTPLARALIDALDPSLVVYYCADRMSETSPAASRLREHEAALLSEADLVVTSSRGLRDMARQFSRNAELLTAGVRNREFERARHAGDVPAIFGTLRGPVVGFAGTLRDAIDVALLAEAAKRAPDLTFLFIGPVQHDVRKLAALPNVHLLGAMPHADVVRHMVHFDVGILPYVMNAYTASVMPMKMKEYLASGLPIVATRLPELLDFAEKHPGVIAFAGDAAGFVAALRAAIETNSADAVAGRLEIAGQYDWMEHMTAMSEMIRGAAEAKSG